MRHLLTLAAPLLVLGLCGAAEARSGVYRWIDHAGNIHYDDQNLLAERVTRTKLNEREVAPEPALRIPQEFIDEVKDRCADFSERAQTYRKAGEIHSRDPFGNRYRLSHNQIILAKAEADQLKQRFCRADAPRLILLEERAARQAAMARNHKLMSKKTGYAR